MGEARDRMQASFERGGGYSAPVPGLIESIGPIEGVLARVEGKIGMRAGVHRVAGGIGAC